MSTNAYEAAEVLMKPSRLVSPGTDFDGAEFPPSQQNIEMAKVWATMAVAYEQRTANLIAMWSKPSIRFDDINGDTVTYGVHIDTPGKILDEIHERLGLDT